jgi:hypothetical protein
VRASQNEAPVEDLGVATSPVNFCRSVGGSVGVAVFGSLIASRLTHLLGDASALAMTPEQMRELPDGEQARLATAFADAIPGVFLDAVPVLLVGFVLTWFLRETVLRTTSATAARSATATAEGAPVPLNGNGHHRNGHNRNGKGNGATGDGAGSEAMTGHEQRTA